MCLWNMGQNGNKMESWHLLQDPVCSCMVLVEMATQFDYVLYKLYPITKINQCFTFRYLQYLGTVGTNQSFRRIWKTYSLGMIKREWLHPKSWGWFGSSCLSVDIDGSVTLQRDRRLIQLAIPAIQLTSSTWFAAYSLSDPPTQHNQCCQTPPNDTDAIPSYLPHFIKSSLPLIPLYLLTRTVISLAANPSAECLYCQLALQGHI